MKNTKINLEGKSLRSIIKLLEGSLTSLSLVRFSSEPVFGG